MLILTLLIGTPEQYHYLFPKSSGGRTLYSNQTRALNTRWPVAVLRVQVTSRVMDWVADKAAAAFSSQGRMTVIVQDNGSSHTSQLTRQQWQRWQEQGLFLFFLPEYCSEMNRIEEKWHQLKTHEIAGRMFEDEYDLAIAVMDGIETRSVKGKYTLERFRFNSG
ncbi:MAG: transposase [Gloeocapsa sp. UFS-A4-WI-NPMV-4B04]|nr:transposase [Gloeocapsa sp. UFS-A4-WI-NPMV-4B04]